MKLDAAALDAFNGALERAGGRLRGESIEAYFGPNPYSKRPVLVCRLNGALPNTDAAVIEARLRGVLPDHAFSALGADRDTLAEAAPLRLAAQAAAGLLSKLLREPYAGGARLTGQGAADCWIEMFAVMPTLHALRTTLTAVLSATDDNSEAAAKTIQQQLAALAKTCESVLPNFTSQVLMVAARAKNIPYLQVADFPSLWQFGWGERSVCFWDASSNYDGMFAYHIARNKEFGKRLIRDLGLPTPAWRPVGPKQDFRAAAEVIGFPCAVKPADRGGGKGVTADVRDMAQLERAVSLARQYASMILIEEHLPGMDYRLLLIEGRLVAASRRDPPSIVGDGRRSVGALIEALNDSRAGMIRDAGYVVAVPLDGALKARISNLGMTMETVLSEGEVVQLRTNANRSTGASCTDVLAKVHPEVARQAELLATAAGFHATGVDYITPDISRTQGEAGGGFLEMNATPGVLVHLAAGVPEEVIGSLFLGSRPGRIPVRLILAPPKAAGTLGEMLKERIFDSDDAAASAAGWAQVGAVDLSTETLTPMAVATAPLRHPSVGSLAIVWTTEDLQRIGLPVDRLERIVVLGDPPEARWMTVLEQSCEEVKRAKSESAAISLICGKRA